MAPAPTERRALVLMAVLVASAFEPVSPLAVPRRAAERAAPLRMVLSTGPEHRRAEGTRIRGERHPLQPPVQHLERSAATHRGAAEPLLARDIKGELRSEVLKMAPHYGQHTVRRWLVARGEAKRAEAAAEAATGATATATAGSVADTGGKVVLAFFIISLLDDAGALLALFCTGCATSGEQEWIKPICSAVPFEPQDVLDQLQQAFHFTSTSLLP